MTKKFLIAKFDCIILIFYALFSDNDHLKLYITAFDKHELENNLVVRNTRWETEYFDFFSSDCKHPKEATNDCTLENYSFGSHQTQHIFPDFTTQEMCFNECKKDTECTFVSWNNGSKSCAVLNTTRSVSKSRNPTPEYRYFCETKNSIIRQMVNPCKSVIETMEDEKWVSKSTRFLKDMKPIENATSIVECWLQSQAIQRSSDYFFWNSTDSSCHASFHSSYICATPAEKKCSKHSG